MIDFVIYPAPRFKHQWEIETSTPWDQLTVDQQRNADRVWEMGPFDSHYEAMMAVNLYFGHVLGTITVQDDTYIPQLAAV